MAAASSHRLLEPGAEPLIGPPDGQAPAGGHPAASQMAARVAADRLLTSAGCQADLVQQGPQEPEPHAGVDRPARQRHHAGGHALPGEPVHAPRLGRPGAGGRLGSGCGSRRARRTASSVCSRQPCSPQVVMRGSMASRLVPRAGSAKHAGQARRRSATAGRALASRAASAGRGCALPPPGPGAPGAAGRSVERLLPDVRVQGAGEPGNPPGDRRLPHHAQVGAGALGQRLAGSRRAGRSRGRRPRASSRPEASPRLWRSRSPAVMPYRSARRASQEVSASPGPRRRVQRPPPGAGGEVTRARARTCGAARSARRSRPSAGCAG